MNESLEARIRRHVEQVDALAPTVEELAPYAEHVVDDARGPVEAHVVVELPVRGTLRPNASGERRGVVMAALAAAAVITALVAGGLLLLRRGYQPEVLLDTPPSTEPTLTTTPVESSASSTAPPSSTPSQSGGAATDDGPRLAYDNTAGALTGVG